jgi:flavin reductase (DIM6/NTAB) family NADH-FMN oxidoreductase RutF
VIFTLEHARIRQPGQAAASAEFADAATLPECSMVISRLAVSQSCPYALPHMKKSLGAQTLLHPTPVVVVGTYDTAGRPNAMTAAWAGICCSQPPCIGVALRRATYTHENILHRRAFTVGVPSRDQVRLVDYLGMVSGRAVDKFRVTGLTPTRSLLVDAPYVEEFPLVLECRLYRNVELGLHTLFVGEIVDVKADPRILDDQGHTDPERFRPLSYAPDTQSYYELGGFVARAFAVGQELTLQPPDPHVA